MENIRVLLNEDTIKERVQVLAEELYQRYHDDEVIFVCTLKGAVFFACDLLKAYKGDGRIEFMRVSSYSGDKSTGDVILKIPLNEEKIVGKNVIIIEDIVDTGYTLEYLRKYINEMKPKSLSECTLLNKKSRRVVPIVPEYVGFEIEDLFVLGYGLDYDEKYRNLPYVGVIEN